MEGGGGWKEEEDGKSLWMKGEGDGMGRRMYGRRLMEGSK